MNAKEILAINESISTVDELSNTLHSIINLESINAATIFFIIIAWISFGGFIKGKTVLQNICSKEK